MATKLLHLRNTTSGLAPSVANLSAGQLAINVADATVFTLNSANVVKKVADAAILADTLTNTIANSFGALGLSATISALDTQFNHGSYYVPSTASGTFPVSAVNGALIVGNNATTSTVFQIFASFGGTFDGSVWTRRFLSSAWSAWSLLYSNLNSGSLLIKTVNTNAPTAGDYTTPPATNQLINGSFAVNQRAKPAAGAVTAFVSDRWYLSSAGATVTNPATGFPGDTSTYLQWQETAGTGTPFLTQSVENVARLNTTLSTVSFLANPSKTMTLTPSFIQNFGTSGSTSVTTTGTPITLVSGVWTRFTQQFTLPSIAGKTIGANHYVRLQLATAASPGTFTLGLTEMQWERGGNFNGYYDEEWEVTFAKCLYFYEVLAGTPFTWSGTLGINNVPQMTIHYAFKRTAASTVTYLNVASTNLNTGNPTIASQVNQGARLNLPSCNVLLGAYATYQFGATVDSELPVT